MKQTLTLTAALAAVMSVSTLTASASPVTSIEDTEIHVTVSMPPTPIATLLRYQPADAQDALFDLEELIVTTPDKYVIDTKAGTIEILEGAEDAIYTVYPRGDRSVSGLLGFTITRNAVTDVRLSGVDGDEIALELHDILALRTETTPADAENKSVSFRLENASDDGMATTYTVGGSEKFTELVTYRAGTFDLVLTSVANPAVTRTYHVSVSDLLPDETSGNHTDGTFWLNEEWFTHKNGSVTYLRNPLPEDETDIVYHAYSRQNEDACFGATSQYGMIYADKLFVMSKQENDKGDIRANGGGRLVVADARTLRHLASFDEIGGDGRACVGAGAGKAYIGTHSGIRVLTWDDDSFTLSDTDIPGISNDTEGGGSDIGGNQQLYNKQIGDMVRAGRYVYALQQGTGVHVIDTETDMAVRTIPDTGVQGITQTADGHVWYASTMNAPKNRSILTEIDPDTTEKIRETEVPGSIGCSWGSWRSTNFFASTAGNMLFWNGGASDITSSGGTLYRWDTEGDPSDLEPFYVFPRTEGLFPGVYRQIYATMRHDSRTNAILFATTTAPSGNYRYNWLNFIDAESGELLSEIRLRDYYWFPSIPIFPDAYAPEFIDIAPVSLESDDDSATLTLGDLAFDNDNIGYNISVTRARNAEERSGAALDEIAEVSEENGILTLRPRKPGNATLALRAESNGRETYAYIPVSVSVNCDIAGIAPVTKTISVSAGKARLRGFDGETFTVTDSSGRIVSSFRAIGDDCTVTLMLDRGIHIMTDSENRHSIKFTI